MLALGTVDRLGMLSRLEQLQQHVGLATMPLSEQVDVVIGENIGMGSDRLFIAIADIVKDPISHYRCSSRDGACRSAATTSTG